MGTEYQKIINLLKDLSSEQRQRLVKSIHTDQGLLLSLGIKRISMLSSISSIESIITGSAKEFRLELDTNTRFASAFKSLIYDILSPDDNMMEFLDFRSEALPEE